MSQKRPSKPGVAGSNVAGRAIRHRWRLMSRQLRRDGARVLLARRSDLDLIRIGGQVD